MNDSGQHSSPQADLLALEAFCGAERNWLLQTIERLVRLESPSGDKRAVDTLGAELSGCGAALGARVTRFPSAAAGDHVRLEFGAGDRQVLLLGHMDTSGPLDSCSACRCGWRTDACTDLACST